MHFSKGICNDQVDRAADAKGPYDILEKEVHVEEYSSKHKEKGVIELFALHGIRRNQEVPTKNSVNIKEVGAGTEINLSRVT